MTEPSPDRPDPDEALPDDAMPGHGVPAPDPAAWPSDPDSSPPPGPTTPPPPPPGSPSASTAAGSPQPDPGEPSPAYPPNPEPPPGAGRRTGRIGGDLQNPANRLGVLSVVAGLLTLVCECLPFVSVVFGVAAVVLGFMHHQRFRAGTASAPNLALVGIVLGVVGIVLSICFGVSSIGDRLRHDVNIG